MTLFTEAQFLAVAALWDEVPACSLTVDPGERFALRVAFFDGNENIVLQGTVGPFGTVTTDLMAER